MFVLFQHHQLDHRIQLHEVSRQTYRRQLGHKFYLDIMIKPFKTYAIRILIVNEMKRV